MLRKLSLVVLCAFALTACKDTITGQLHSNETLTFNTKKGPNQVPAGKWHAVIEIPNKKEVRLVVPLSDNKKDVMKASFKVPKGTVFPEGSGEFYLNSTQSGQHYDIEGKVQANHVDSQETWKTETCSYQVQRQECYYNGYQHVCRIVTYTMSGWRDVRFFVRTTTRETNISLFRSNKTVQAAKFSSVEETVQRVYTYTGHCG